VRTAWDVADGSEKNQLARTLIDDPRIEGDRIVAEVYVEGRLRLNTWNGPDGGQRSALELSA
jgi:hypothetical protein